MDKLKLQNALKSVADQMEALIDAACESPMTAEQKTQYDALEAQANGYRESIDRVTKAEALKAWQNQSAGSVVAASFERVTMPGEGQIPGISADPKTGEMFAVDGAFKSIGEKKLELLKSGAYKDAYASWLRNFALYGDQGIKAVNMKILEEGADTHGAFWLPPDFRAEVVKKMAVITSVRQNASIYTTGTDMITFPAVTYAANDLYTTGARFTWRGSTGLTSDPSETTNPVAGNLRIPVHLATCDIIVTREQLEDNAFDLLGYISEIMAETFGLGEEDAFTNGDGAAKPAGFLQHPTVAIANGSTSTIGGVSYGGGFVYSGSSGALAWGGATTGVIGCEAALPPQYELNAKWFANKGTYAALRALNAGTATLPQWSLGDSWPNYANGYNASLLGYKTVKDQFMPDVAASATPLMLGDLKGYYIIDRVGLSVEIYREPLAIRDQVLVHARKRVGGQLVRYWMMKFLTCTA